MKQGSGVVKIHEKGRPFTLTSLVILTCSNFQFITWPYVIQCTDWNKSTFVTTKRKILYWQIEE